nr:hypothetical protein [uncultured Blautia sp.]
MNDFLEEFGGVIVANFLIIMAVSLLTGVFTAVLMFLGISAVAFLVWFFWMHGRAVQVLMEIWFGKIQVKTKQKILIQPKFFVIDDADHGSSKVYKVQTKDEECQKAINYLMKHICFVEAYCNVYLDFPTGIRPVEGNKFVQLCSYEMFHFLKSENTQYIDRNGSIITLGSSAQICLFLQNTKSIWDVAFNKDFQEILELYKKNSDFKVSEVNNQHGNGIYFLHMSNMAAEQPQKEKKTMTPCPNPDILEHIQQVDEKLAQGMQLTGISNSQWQNIVKPSLMEIADISELNTTNRSEALEIIKQVEENLKADEKENFEAEATLVAMRTFLSMNGCLKK